MKQKIVIKVLADCDKCRKKAMKVAAATDGVASVALQGDDNDRLVVVGVGVDAACLTTTLRKKACSAKLETVEEVKPPPPEPGPGKDGKEDKGKDKPEPCPPWSPCPPVWCPQPRCDVYKVVYEPYDPPPGCTVM